MLIDSIRNDMTTAMKAKEKVKVQTLRAVIGAVKEAEVAGETAQTLTDDEVEQVISQEAKRRVEAAEAFDAGGATERAATERAQLEVLVAYLPKALNEDDLVALVDAELEAGAFKAKAQMGAAMKVINAKVAGRADGRVVAELVKSRLQ